eukprot:Hpha_TRINITY_DN34117_c0_g1::TRINITY_DN34117_c0_g1_i1::g.75751::m.75751/K04711/ACER3, YDC1; dihydroceramidase
MPEGFWGPVDATVDWCEDNYVYSVYVAELFNTVTSIPMILLGSFGMWSTMKRVTNETRFKLAFVALVCVGIGSTAFHATMRYTAQLMDEVPMLWGNLAFVFCLVDHERTMSPKTRTRLCICLFVWGSWCTACYRWLRMYWVFLLGYSSAVGFMTIYSAYLVWWKYTDWEGVRENRAIWCTSLVSYFLGLTLWVVDNNFCRSVKSLHLHAWWHILAGFGTYMFIMLTVALHSRSHSTVPMLKHRVCGTEPPHVVYKTSDSAV